jgi:hypothetical protein
MHSKILRWRSDVAGDWTGKQISCISAGNMIEEINGRKSLIKKSSFGEKTRKTEQMTPAGSGIAINLYIPKSHHTFLFCNNDDASSPTATVDDLP